MESGVLKFVRSFDAFDFGEEAKPMPLALAASEAARLAAHDPHHFYRVVPVDEAMTGFRIEKVSKQREWSRSRAYRSGGRADHAPYTYNYRYR